MAVFLIRVDGLIFCMHTQILSDVLRVENATFA